jgi:hypothetical protein
VTAPASSPRPLPLSAEVTLAVGSERVQELVEPVEDAEPADREPPDSKDGADQAGMLESADRPQRRATPYGCISSRSARSRC